MTMEQKSMGWAGPLIAFFVGFFLFLGIGEIGMRLLYPQWSEFYSGRFIEWEAVPGYSGTAIGKPGFDGYFAQNNGDFRVSVQINDFGLRNSEPAKAAGDKVWVVGDSMAFGWGVEQSEMYSSVITDRSGIATYNVASPGADICGYQALIARMPTSVRPTGVIVGLILENDIREYDCEEEAARRNVEIKKTAGPNISLTSVKHWFVQHSALYNAVSVLLKRVPVVLRILKKAGLVEYEHAYKLTFDDARSDRLAKSVAQELSRTRSMLPSDIPFGVLIAPGRFEIRDSDPVYRNFRVKVAQALAEAGIDVIDPLEAFKKAGFAPTHFVHDGHWSRLGHQIAGEAAANWLTDTRHQ